MSRIVRMSENSPVTDEMKEELRKIAAMPDSEINTTDIPEWTEEQFAAARLRRAERREPVTQQHKRAS
jgi:hypothetical protein